MASRYSPTDGAPSGVNALLEDRRGTVWAATGNGLFRYAGTRWSPVTAADGYDGEQAISVYEIAPGACGSGRSGSIATTAQLHLVDRTATYVDSLVEDDAGNLWVTDRAAIVKKLGTSSPCASIAHPPPAARLSHHPDGRGGLLVASFSGGLFRLADPTGARPFEPVDYEHRCAARRGRSIAIATTTSGSVCAAACCACPSTRSNPRARSTVSIRMACGPRRSPLTAASGSPPRKP